MTSNERTFHQELPVVPKCVVYSGQNVHPFGGPFLASVGPTTSELAKAPRISNKNEPLPANFAAAENAVSVVDNYACK